MKKLIFPAFAILILLCTSCSKTSNSSNNGSGGSWTLNSNNYPAVTCIGNQYGIQGTLTAATTATQAANASDIVLTFYNTLPTTPGNFVVISGNGNPTSSNQVQILTTVNGITGTTYLSTGAGTNQTVYVTVSGGKISVSGSGINMTTGSGSTGVLSLNLTQLQ